MPVTSVEKDPASCTMTITAELGATPERAWQLWADPRQLERWWGPPTYPATVEEHDLSPGGRVHYFMTGPEGDTSHGWWEIVSADPFDRLELKDGFADGSGEPNDDLPVSRIVVTFTAEGSARTRMAIETHFPSAEAMEQLISMGMEEGMAAAMGQIDGVLTGG